MDRNRLFIFPTPAAKLPQNERKHAPSNEVPSKVVVYRELRTPGRQYEKRFRTAEPWFEGIEETCEAILNHSPVMTDGGRVPGLSH